MSAKTSSSSCSPSISKTRLRARVESEERLGLDCVDLEAVGDDLLGVITPTFSFGSDEEPSSQFLAGHVELDDGLELNPPDLVRQFVCLHGLPEVPRKAVEHITALAARPNNRLSQRGEDQLVRHEVSAPKVV